MIPFDSFFTLFFVAFIIIFILSVATILAQIFRRQREAQSKEEGTLVKEREIIREVVKIRCSYCGNLYDEKYDKCPYCGGKREP